VFVITDDRDEATASAALAAGATGCLSESAARHGERLATRIERAVERASERRNLEASTARFRALTENATFAVVTASDDGRIQYANDAVESIVGYAPEELVGERISTIVPARYQNSHPGYDRPLPADWGAEPRLGLGGIRRPPRGRSRGPSGHLIRRGVRRRRAPLHRRDPRPPRSQALRARTRSHPRTDRRRLSSRSTPTGSTPTSTSRPSTSSSGPTRNCSASRSRRRSRPSTEPNSNGNSSARSQSRRS